MSYWLGILAAAITAATIGYGLGHQPTKVTVTTTKCQTEGHW